MRAIMIFLVSLCLVLPIAARNITFDDLYSLPRCGDAQISPDGEFVVFTKKTNDLDSNTSETHLWIMGGDGSAIKQLTDGSSDEWHPRWSPDGRTIYFLSDSEEEGTQIWSVPAVGGEVERMTLLSTNISEFECAPSGKSLMLVSNVFPDCHNDSCNKARLDEIEANPVKAKLYDRLLYRHYSQWDNGRVARLFVFDLTDSTYRELYSGPYDTPTALLDGYGDYAFSPDGEEVCFVMSTDSMPAVRVNNDLYITKVEGGDPVRITRNKGLDTSPQYSPDGKYIAYHAMARAGYESDQRDLVLYDRDKSAHVNLTADYDLSIGEFVWAPQSDMIYFTSIEHGFNRVRKVSIESHEIKTVLANAVFGNLQISPDSRYMIVSRSLSDKPYELYRLDLSHQVLTRLTHFTEDVLAGVDLKRAKEFWFVGALEDSVHGFLTLPPNFDRTQKYPLALLIHGGPQWCWLGDFNYYGWNTQLMAAQGYVVAQIDPHGSVGYGIKFKEYVSGNWGKGDFEDLMKGVDYLIEKCPYIDSDRMVALGRSYGGFMINWICGHTDRFKCLISIDGTYNHISGYGSTEELWFPEYEFKGTPWDNWEEYERSSPVTYAKNFKTPTMVIHGQKDYRVDLSESLQMFTALQRMGVPSQLLYFPDEGHSVRKLKNLRYVYEKQFEWLSRWLTP
jgi:dipeptidyl aminopeptidase/acylaminoacyl peptidase